MISDNRLKLEKHKQGLTELGYVRFGASYLDAWLTYLGDLLGMEIRDDSGDDKIWARTDFWHHRICLEKNAIRCKLAVHLSQ